MSRREELARLRRDKKLELLEKQLSEFYWPIYLRLEKDNLIWEKVFNQDGGLESAVRQKLEMTYILPNHDEIMTILEAKIHLARAHQPLSDAINRYIRHIAVYRAIRDAGITERDPAQFDAPYPSDLFGFVESEKNRLQAEYDHLLDLEQAIGR